MLQQRAQPPVPVLGDHLRLEDLSPMLLEEARPFSNPAYLFEVKYDGYRMLGQFENGRSKLQSRNGADATHWFPEAAKALASLHRGTHVLDGEMCVLDANGYSDFVKLHARARRRSWYPGADPVVYVVFDMLVESGQSIMEMPFVERRRRLVRLCTPVPPGIVLSPTFEGDLGLALYHQAAAAQLEGVVAKLKDSRYVPGSRSRDWLKIKRPGATPAQRWERGEG